MRSVRASSRLFTLGSPLALVAAATFLQCSVSPAPSADGTATGARTTRSEALGPAAACTGAIELPSVPGVAAGKHPVKVATADFNGDGRPDFVVSSAQANAITVVLG